MPLDCVGTALLRGHRHAAQPDIEIEQRAVLTRRAFEAALTIFNDTTDPLGEILVEINIEDSDGNPANHLFGISDPDLSGALSGFP